MSEEKQQEKKKTSPYDPLTGRHWVDIWCENAIMAFLLFVVAAFAISLLVIGVIALLRAGQ